MNVFLGIAAVLGTLGLLAGTLGSHLWQDLLLDRDTVDRFHRAEEYLFYHALALAVVAQLVERFPAQKFQSVGWCLAAGAFIFSGSLLVFSLTGFRPITNITPVGGTLLFIGWILLGVRACRMYWRRRG